MILGISTGPSAAATAKCRAWLAVLFVSLFLVSGFVHAIQHVDALANTATTTELALHGDSGEGDASDKPAVTAEHCCGCASLAYLPLIQEELPAPVHVIVRSMPMPQLAGHTIDYEPPPPKSLT
jgi:hypothetical protein